MSCLFILIMSILLIAEKQYTTDTPWAIMVADAAPAIPHLKTRTKRRSSATFVKAAVIIAMSGVLLSPNALKSAASKLYIRLTATPPSIILR